MDQQAFVRGRQAGEDELACWQANGYRSQEQYKRRLQQEMREYVRRVQQLPVPRSPEHARAWEGQLAYLQGYLSALQ